MTISLLAGSSMSTCITMEHIFKGKTFLATFMGSCIANNSQYVSNKMQLHTVYLYRETALHVSGVISTYHQERQKYSNIYPTRCNFTQFIYIWKMLYMFRVLFLPIIRSAYNCIYSIWCLSDRYCYLPLSRQVAVTAWQIPDAVQSFMRSWWWVEVTPETCRAVSRYK
jgi:hypothetical protein